MCGKKLVSNLVWVLSGSFSIPVYAFDRNHTRELPCIVVSYDSEEGSMPGIYGHYTVSGKVLVAFQGYEDTDNTEADTVAQQVIDIIGNRDLDTSLNKPLSGTDHRPLSGFGINRLFIRGTNRAIEDSSTVVEVIFDAYCVAKDF